MLKELSLSAGWLALVVPVVLGAGEAPGKTRQAEVEALGVVQRATQVGGYVLSRGTEAYPPRLIIGLRGGDGSFVVNLKDGSSFRADGPGFDKEYVGWPSAIGKDGKVFVATHRGGLAVYDPLENSIKLVHPIANARWLRGVAVGPDGGVYVSDYPTGAAARFEPQTGKVDYYGPQGGPFRIKHIYGYSVGSDGEWVYTAAGKIPWYVVAYRRQTGKQHNLLQFSQSDHPEVYQRGDQVFLSVKMMDLETRSTSTRYYRLSGGKATPVDAMPRHSSRGLPGANLPQPEVQALRRNLPLVEGGAALRYRPVGEKEWRQTTIAVKGMALNVQRIAPASDGRVLVATGHYGHVFLYDPKSKVCERVGSPAQKNVYDLLSVQGRLYFCGYPNAVLGMFENDEGRILGAWHEVVGSKHALHMVRGADGRIYSGNHAEREFVGGALGWYDPVTGELDGVRLPNDDCEWLTTALEGGLIVYSSDFSLDPMHPEIKKRSGRLIVYDTESHSITHQFSPVAHGSAGIVVEIKPGLVLGFSQHEGKPVMYTADVIKGEVLQRIGLPAEARGDAQLGPDGMVYTFLGETLMRVNPRTLVANTICPAKPGRMAFVGEDLYLAGDVQLRRVSHVTR